MASLRARAYSSIANLGHGLDVFGLCVDACFDEVELTPGGERMQVTVCGPYAQDVPLEPQHNTATRALQALLEAHELRVSLYVRIAKGIRPGSGLGSSAASAAAAVFAANTLFSLEHTRAELVRFAAEGERVAAGAAHADNVAAALCGGFVIVVAGDPLTVSVVQSSRPPVFVLALPGVHLATREARQALPRNISMQQYTEGVGHAALTVAAWQSGDARALGQAIEGSFTDACRRKLIPGFDEVRRLAKQAGAAGVTISGAGPAMVAVVGDRALTDRVAEAMRRGFESAGLGCETFAVRPAPGAEIVSQTQ
jgi:homoserine kinase